MYEMMHSIQFQKIKKWDFLAFVCRFTVYIVIPMHPEGVATDGAIQEMLFWQRHTMQMMYSRIAQAIYSSGIEAHPTEYLMFFCLGKKEAAEVPPQLAKPTRGSRAAKLRKVRRLLFSP